MEAGTMTSRQSARAVLLALIVGSFVSSVWRPAAAAGVGPNLTGLPTYPNLKSGATLGNPHACTFYSGSSMDSFNAVVAWYRAHLPGQTPAMTKNVYGGTQADFGMHAGTQVVVFTSPSVKNAGTSLVLNKGCPKASS